jgi:argininosuccinate synthase
MIKEYYNLILNKYINGEYKLRVAKGQDTPEINEKEYPLYAINYLIYEYLKDNNDNRWKLLLDFILVPDGVNQEGCDIDFTKVDFEEFFYFMLSVKS